LRLFFIVKNNPQHSTLKLHDNEISKIDICEFYFNIYETKNIFLFTFHYMQQYYKVIKFSTF